MRDDWDGSGSGPAAVFGTGGNEKFLLAEIQQKFNQTHIIIPHQFTPSDVCVVCSYR